MKKNVLISGGSGFIGKYLTRLLIEKGFSVSILSRSTKQNTADIRIINGMFPIVSWMKMLY